jgi:polyhydroxyalkanoate synthesis regulator phasin
MADASELEKAVAEMISDGKLTREELKRFNDLMLADGQLSVLERRCIDHVLNMIANGQLEIVD